MNSFNAILFIAALPILVVVAQNDGATSHICPPNQVWDGCGTACPETCDKKPELCDAMCKEGCRCRDGFVLDENKRCILKSECPTNNHTCPPNQVWDECGTACPETCDKKPELCMAMCKVGCRCRDGYVLDENKRCIPKRECPAKNHTCPPNQVWDECGSACPETCDKTPRLCPAVCKAGCRCRDGYVLDENARCIMKSECPSDDDKIMCTSSADCPKNHRCPHSNVQCFAPPCPRFCEAPCNSDKDCPAGQTCPNIMCFAPPCLRFCTGGLTPTPAAGCEVMLCAPNHTCVEDSAGRGSCVPTGGRGPRITCANVRCASGTTCRMVGRWPRCVKNQ